MAISRADFGSFSTELVTRNPNLGIPALEDGLFANSLIFNYRCFGMCVKVRKGEMLGNES